MFQIELSQNTDAEIFHDLAYSITEFGHERHLQILSPFFAALI